MPALPTTDSKEFGLSLSRLLVFRAHPVFNVDAGGLSLKIGGLTLKLPASDFNLASAEVLGLKTVGINLDDLGIKTISADSGKAIAETLKDFGFSSATASGREGYRNMEGSRR